MRLLAGLLAALASLTASAHAQAPAPDDTVWLEYRLAQHVVNGTGAYEGWSDRTTATGRYEFSPDPVEPEVSRVWAQYAWRYHSPDDDRGGAEDRRVSFTPDTRLYREARIDLDDYDESAALGTRAIWWQIPTSLAPGATVRILDEDFVVVGRVPASGATHGRESVLVEGHGAGRRDDAYGVFSTTFHDQYWFDAETGWFLREVRTEHDTGALSGEFASFDVEETVELTAASYLPGTSPTWAPSAERPTPRSTPELLENTWDDGGGLRRSLHNYACPLLSVLGVILTAIYVFRRNRQSKNDYQGKITRFTGGEPVPGNVSGISKTFGELIPHLIRQTYLAGQPVVIARGSLGIEGVALGAPPGEAATIFAADTATCEALRQELGATEFFSEVRHEHSFSAVTASSQHNVTLPGKHAYNVLETHEVLALEPVPADVSYDRDMVRRATAADLPAVIQLADTVYSTSCRAWIESATGTGDVILVATADDAIVGFAMVSVAGTTARFHGLTVAEAHRGKGIAKELNRARVRIASDLGAARAIVEVAAWNVASLEIARSSGFAKIGAMYVETTSATPVEKRFRR